MQPEASATTMPASEGERPLVLVTGATGFIGSHLALRLRREGWRVRALVRPGSEVRGLKEVGVELVEGQLLKSEDVARAAEGVDVIYHIAGAFRIAGQPDSYYHDVHVGGTANVLAVARRHGAARVVHNSTVGVHGDNLEIPCQEESPLNPGDIYQVTKLEGEKLARAAFERDLRGVIVRPAGVYGPGDLRFRKLFRTIYQRSFRMFGSGEVLWHAVYIDDLIDGFLLAGTRSQAIGQTYILAGPRYITLNQFVAEVARALDVPPPRGRLPYWPLAAGALMCEALCKPLRIDPPLHLRRVRFFVNNRAFSIEKARRELGYEPKFDTPEGLRRTATWYREQGHLAGEAA